MNAEIENHREPNVCRGKLRPDVLGTPYATRVDAHMKRLVSFWAWSS